MRRGRGGWLLIMGLAFVGYGGSAMRVAPFDLAALCR